jgi:Zn-dependent protease
VNTVFPGDTPEPPAEPVPPARAQGPQGLRFNLFGFPTRIDPSFLLIVALIGFDGTASHLAIWVALALVSVLGHELGHALAARRLGATASISLQGMGGLTRSSRAEPLRRGESAWLTVAGPAAGILLGLPVLFAIHALGWPSWTMGGFALRTAAFTTLGWSALNLLPIIPLDGGHLLELALPGTPLSRQRLAAQLSIAFAVAGGVLAYKAGMSYAGLLAILFAAQNLAILKQTNPRPPLPAAPSLPKQTPAQLLMQPPLPKPGRLPAHPPTAPPGQTPPTPPV